MALGDRDVPTLLKYFGVDVTFGAATTKGLLDTFDAQLPDLPAVVIGRVTVVTIQTDTLPNLAKESVITVAGVQYRVFQINALKDGALTQLGVSRV